MGYMNRPARSWRHIVVLTGLAAAIRIAPWLSVQRITFDEGVFLASTDLAHSGLTPFQDFFVSQGPLFIPLLRLGQIVSFGDPRGARTTLLVAGVVIAVAIYLILTRITSPPRAFLLASFAAVSGSVFLAAGPVQSDGVALALALAALAVALRPNTNYANAAVIGLLLGAAVSVKSLHVIPIVLTIVVLMSSRLNWGQLSLVALVGAGFVFAVASPFGIGDVWDQYVLFHLAKDNSPDLVANTVGTGKALAQYDIPLLALLIAAVVSPLMLRDRTDTNTSELPRWLVIFWLATTVVLLLGFTAIDSGFTRTLAFLVPPLIAVAAFSRAIPIRLLVGIAAIGVIIQPFLLNIVPTSDAEEDAATEQISTIPIDRWFVSDDPGLGWAAGRLSNPDTVDPSYARFQTGYMTDADVSRALNDPTTCIFVSTSGRFELADVTAPDDYLATEIPGVFRRADC